MYLSLYVLKNGCEKIKKFTIKSFTEIRDYFKFQV